MSQAEIERFRKASSFYLATQSVNLKDNNYPTTALSEFIIKARRQFDQRNFTQLFSFLKKPYVRKSQRNNIRYLAKRANLTGKLRIVFDQLKYPLNGK